MNYDLEIIVPVSLKYEKRINDFKKYGLINIKNRKVLVNLVVSNNEDILDLEKDWPEELAIKVFKNSDESYIRNLISLFLSKKDCDSKWFMKLDDDSSTDVDNLLSNLDEFYDFDKSFYLCADAYPGFSDHECHLVGEYLSLFDNYKKIGRNLMHEFECCVISNKALFEIMSNKKSTRLLEERKKMSGGVSDCVFAYASSLAKIYPISCPFLTHFPNLKEFSFCFSEGIKNHIHHISREPSREHQFNITPNFIFKILSKMVDNNLNLIEQKISSGKYLYETIDHLNIIKFNKNYTIDSKFNYLGKFWLEENQNIQIFNENCEFIYELSINDKSDLIKDSLELKKLEI